MPKSKSEEMVMVVPAHTLQLDFIGFSRDPRHMPSMDAVEFQPRSLMEADESFKQLIPYVVVCHVSTGGSVRTLTYRRGGSGDEARLHTKRSIGFGGHISLEDTANDAGGHSDAYTTGMLRELGEELKIVGDFTHQRIGVIYDPSNEVGRVHLGIVHVLQLGAAEVHPNESCIEDHRFCPPAQLDAEAAIYESWSQILIDNLIRNGAIANDLQGAGVA